MRDPILGAGVELLAPTRGATIPQGTVAANAAPKAKNMSITPSVEQCQP